MGIGVRCVVIGLAAWAAFGFGTEPACADDSDTQQWSLLVVNKKLSERWLGYFEVQPRFGDNASDLERLLIRPAIGYRLSPKLSLWQGYAWTPLFSPFFDGEHRTYQQVLYDTSVGATGVVSRTRFEQRFIEGAGGTSHRVRSMLRLSHPISRDRKWLAIGYDELFWNLNSTDNGPVRGFDQNRLFLGVGRQINSSLRVETGYMLNPVNRPRTRADRQLHNWVVQLTLNL